MATPIEERFWPKVRIRSADECWEWQAAKDGHGYGAIAASHERRTLQAHRVAYELAHGPITGGLHVLHRCDNPACVSPAHLFLGTHKENMDDMAAKGRGMQGGAKLTEGDVREIRATGNPSRDLARMFGVTPTIIRQIKRRTAWAHVQ